MESALTEKRCKMNNKAIKKLREFIVNGGYKGKQTFDRRGMAGDTMTTIYDEDGITVDFCYHYDYLEIFGLTDEQYKSLSDILDIC